MLSLRQQEILRPKNPDQGNPTPELGRPSAFGDNETFILYKG